MDSENKNHCLDIAENKISLSRPGSVTPGSVSEQQYPTSVHRCSNQQCCLLGSSANERNKSIASHFFVLRAMRVKTGISGNGHIHLLTLTL